MIANFSFIRDKINEVIIPKYKGKLDLFSISNVEGDINQVLSNLVKNKLIINFDKVKIYRNANDITIYCDIYVMLGKIKINLKVSL